MAPSTVEHIQILYEHFRSLEVVANTVSDDHHLSKYKSFLISRIKSSDLPQEKVAEALASI